MEKQLTIYYTSDTHGYFSPVDYASGLPAATGVANCASNYVHNGDSLVIDGGDTLQGSPFIYYLHRQGEIAPELAAKVMNLAGYRFVTLGNHDFNYGREILEKYLDELDAICLCANVEGLEQVRKTETVTMKSGLKVGLTGITTPFIRVWEKPEHLEGIWISDPIPAAREALEDLRQQGADLTICIYHGGFENDLESGALLSDSGENQGWRICQELDFDILLSGHQHMKLEDRRIRNTFTCQPPDKASGFMEMQVTVEKPEQGPQHEAETYEASCGEGRAEKERELNGVAAGRVRARSAFHPAGDKTLPSAAALLREAEAEAAAWLDTPVGHLDTELMPEEHILMAEKGSLIANFFNQVQLDATGADISATALGNEIRGLEKEVSIRDIVATYIYPNTLVTMLVDRETMRLALERSAEYFELQSDGTLRVSDVFLKPKAEHYNFDYLAGLEAVVDVRKPVGSRVVSIRRNGEELREGEKLRFCTNNYRATGTGGYPFYADCEVVKSDTTEIVELIMDYVLSHPQITVDKTHWLKVIR